MSTAHKRLTKAAAKRNVYKTRHYHGDSIVAWTGADTAYGKRDGCQASKGAEQLKHDGFLPAKLEIPAFPTADWLVAAFSALNPAVELGTLKGMFEAVISANDAGDHYMARRRYAETLLFLAI